MTMTTERLMNLVLASGPQTHRALSAGLARFGDQLDELTTVDRDTGAIAFAESDVRAAAVEAQRSTSFVLGSTFVDDVVADLRGGYAFLDAARTDVVPWRALGDPRVVDRLSESRLVALGVSAAGQDDVRRELEQRTGNGRTVDPAVAARLAAALTDKRLLRLAVEAEKSRADLLPEAQERPKADPRPTPNRGESGVEGGPVVGSGNPFDPALAADFATNCLPNLSMTTISATVGGGLCMDAGCARKLATILSQGGGPILAKAGVAALGAGTIGAAVTAGVSAAGGWVALIVALSLVGFSIWLDSVITDNGACIHFPWWIGFGPVPFGR